MTTRTTPSLVVALALAFALVASSHVAFACSVMGTPPTLSQAVDKADVVVIARAVSLSDVSGMYATSATLLVEEYLKGSGPVMLTSNGYGSGAGDCHNPIELLDRAIYFLDGAPWSGETLNASYAWVYAAILEDNAETISEIAGHTGSREAPIIGRLDLLMSALFFQFPLGIISLFVLAVIGLAALFFVWRKGRHMKRPARQVQT